MICLTDMPDEKNDKSKQLIRQKIEEYIARAETLKGHLQQAEDKTAKRAMGANGMANGGTGGKSSKCVLGLCLAVTALMGARVTIKEGGRR